MADVDFDEFDGGYGTSVPQAGRLSHLVHLAGAVCSVALVIGVAVWGYKLAVRDVSGVPVVRAMEGPMRIAPENPGGEVADHQGLAVNTIAAIGTAAPPADRLVLAPRPVELSLEDGPGLALSGAMPEAPETMTAASADAMAIAAATAAPVEPETLGPDPDAVAQALAEALAAEDIVTTSDTAVLETPTALDPPETAIRPRARPTTLDANAPASTAEAVDLALAEPAAAPAVAELDPAAIPMGTRLVQLGAFDTADQARSEWIKLANVFGPMMEGKAMVVQAAESGGRTFYRLRAHGFADEDEARGFCTSLLEQSASCIPVEQR
jgi:hypothetical protein